MPLIIVSGLPTSGKSTRAAQLYSYLAERIAAPSTATPSPDAPTDSSKPAADSSKPAADSSKPAADSSKPAADSSKPAATAPSHRLHLISDQSLSISRTVYDLSALPPHARSANALEKDARASIYGAVKRVLTDKDIVILDGMNYIKGWRYQLYCEAKAVRTPSVVLQIGVSKQRAQAVNEARLRRRRAATGSDETPEENTPDLPEVTLAETDTEEPYEPENWDNLVFRYEEPNPMTRWDSPLFALVWDDDEAQTRKVFDDVWEAIAGEGRGAVKPNRATVQRGREAGGDYLYVLDRETQDVVRRILEAQQEGAGGGEAVRVPRGGTAEAGEEGQLVVQLPGTRLGLPQLQRLRRAFVGLNRGGIGLEGVGDLGVARMRESFVGYLNDAFDKDE